MADAVFVDQSQVLLALIGDESTVLTQAIVEVTETLVAVAEGPQGVAGPQGPQGVPGANGSAGTIAWNETVTGTIDGSNATFTLAHAPNPAVSLMLFLNGLKQQPSNDFTLSGNTITFNAGAIPVTGDLLEATYPF